MTNTPKHSFFLFSFFFLKNGLVLKGVYFQIASILLFERALNTNLLCEFGLCLLVGLIFNFPKFLRVEEAVISHLPPEDII